MDVDEDSRPPDPTPPEDEQPLTDQQHDLPPKPKTVATVLALRQVSSTAHKCVPVPMNATTCDRLWQWDRTAR